MVVSRPSMQSWSLRLIGRPWRGPTTFPIVLRCSSSSAARFRARSTKISVKQFVYLFHQHLRAQELQRELTICWATMALL
jgi:hypothetical protein